jgi:hypothetical protein
VSFIEETTLLESLLAEDRKWNDKQVDSIEYQDMRVALEDFTNDLRSWGTTVLVMASAQRSIKIKGPGPLTYMDLSVEMSWRPHNYAEGELELRHAAKVEPTERYIFVTLDLSKSSKLVDSAVDGK